MCLSSTSTADIRRSWHSRLPEADDDVPDLRYPQTTATPTPAGHTEPEGDVALVEALKELAAIEEPADSEVLRMHVGNGTVTRVTD